MTFALSYHPNVPALMAQPRLFLGPTLPGYVSPSSDTVLFPMTLDGTMTDTGVRNGNQKGVARFIERHQHRFVSASPKPSLFRSQKEYEASVHPAWLVRVRDWIDDDWERYAASSRAERPAERLILQTVKGQMQSLYPLFSACLYLGTGDLPTETHWLYAHDLGLYGHPVEVGAGNLYPTLNLLETFCLALEQMRAGTAEKIVILRNECDMSFHDVENLSQTHGPFVQFARQQGIIVGLPRDDIRPELVGRADKSGNINPAELEGEKIHPAYQALQGEILQRISVFLGFLLLIHYRVDESRIENLKHGLNAAMGRGPLATQEHLQFVLESAMFRLGHNLSRDDSGFEGKCLLAGFQALTRFL